MDDLSERVAAVERALTDGDGDLTALAEGAARADRVAALESTVADLQADLADVEAATQALRGYVGNVRSVNESVEERADAAMAAVESLEEHVDGGPPEPSTGDHGAVPDASTTTRESQTQPVPDHGSRTSTGHESPEGVCRACGRPESGDQAAADGGDQVPGDAGPAGVHEREQRARPEAGPPGRADGGLDTFDPTDESHRVRLESAPGAPVGGRPDAAQDVTGGEDEARPGLLARVRALL